MGLFDELRCKYPLPIAGANDLLFQTKSFDSPYMDQYEIREDGTIWYETYVLRHEENADAPLGFYQRRDDATWVQLTTTDEVRFYTSDANEKWIEFSAHFVGGKLKHLEVVDGGAP